MRKKAAGIGYEKAFIHRYFKSKYLYGACKRKMIHYGSGSQTVRRDAPVRRFNFPKASRNILVLCH